MNIYLSIDDTDNLDSPGSGELSEVLANELQDGGLATSCSNISRHQLFVHQDIPYTSHNSSMCFSAVIAERNLAEVIRFAKHFLEKAAAPGSDPGLCIASEKQLIDRQSLVDFGQKAKQTILTKQQAYSLAQKLGIHLSEHGGTGDGIVGALAGIGLRLSGNDGRIRGWLRLGTVGQTTNPKALCSHPFIDGVVDEQGMDLLEDTEIILAEERLKSVLLNFRQVIPVMRTGDGQVPGWTTLTGPQVKRF
jgi:hypothetical protein